ncbi:response regulator [Halorientalis brevis]|uniref:Response regulator n=1 Tax=Halorientalis brevis TaxID=1126241 RepID=A0ABD6C7K9_9EURY|nr:response regulator [Halorientalis brevis]
MLVSFDATDRPIRVLHLDDERGSLATTENYFERFWEGIRIETTTDPNGALDRLRDDPDGFDLLLCDFEMPAMDGLSVLARVRDAGLDIPFILYTGKGSNAVESEAIDAGVTAYVEKGEGMDHLESLAEQIEEVVADT